MVLLIIYRAGGKRKHERSEYFLFLARYRQNRKCEARQTRSGWILEGDEKDKYDMVFQQRKYFCRVEEKKSTQSKDLSRLNRGIEKLR